MHRKEVTLTPAEWRRFIDSQRVPNPSLRVLLRAGSVTFTTNGVRYQLGSVHTETVPTPSAAKATAKVTAKPRTTSSRKPVTKATVRSAAKPANSPPAKPQPVKVAPVVQISASQRVADLIRARAEHAAQNHDDDLPPEAA